MGFNKRLFTGAADTPFVATDNFETELYNGGSEATVTFDFAPDMIWIKSRGGAYDHILFDSVRGIDSTNEPYVRPNQALAEVTGTNRFSLSNGGKTMTIPVDSNINNTALGSPYVVWAWRCPDAFSHSASGSQLASSGKSNQAAGISIVSFTGNDTAGATVKHNLGVKPELILFKARGVDNNWGVYASAITADKFLILNSTAVEADSDTPFNDTEPDATVITFGTSGSFNSLSLIHIS